MQGQRSIARALAGPLAGMWRSGAGPTHSALDTTFAILGIEPEGATKEKRVLNAVLSSPNDDKTKDIVAELVELLRVERTFEADDESTQYRLTNLRDTLAQYGAELTQLGELHWQGRPQSNSPNFNTGEKVNYWRGPSSSTPRNASTYQASRPESTPINRSVTDEKLVIKPKIFIVYGHDRSLRNEIELLLRNWGFQGDQVIILDKLASGGLTLIEKFEQHSQHAAFAIVLGTPDDRGHRKDHPEEAKHRARQNVVLEFGYFLGKLGRNRVVFIDGGIEKPSDIHGLLVINTEDHDWTTRLAREMKDVGLPVSFL